MLTMALTGKLVTDVLGIQRLTQFGGRFTAQVWPGDTLTSELVVDSVTETVVTASVRTTNQHGVQVFSGSATASLAPLPAAEAS
jgi:acyl dehydratase